LSRWIILNELDLELVAILSIHSRTIIQLDVARIIIWQPIWLSFFGRFVASLLLKHVRRETGETIVKVDARDLVDEKRVTIARMTVSLRFVR